METESKFSFNVKQNGLQEFADKWIVDTSTRRDDIRKAQIDPYYIIGQEKMYIKKSFIDKLQGDPVITFELFDEGRNFRSQLVNTYAYSIEQYDDVCFELRLIDFKVELRK